MSLTDASTHVHYRGNIQSEQKCHTGDADIEAHQQLGGIESKPVKVQKQKERIRFDTQPHVS